MNLNKHKDFINIDKIKDVLKTYEPKAKKYVDDKKKASDLLNIAIKKADHKKGTLEEIWGNLQLLFNALKDWTNGNYKKIPTGSIMMIIIAILYFVSPIDLIPDFIPGIGYIDDVVIITYVIKQINNDLLKYKEWRQNQGDGSCG